MSKTTASAVIFAINAAIRLGRNMQQAFAQSVRSKAITLPLPKFDFTINRRLAEDFFNDEDVATGGKQFVDQIEALRSLHKRVRFDPNNPEAKRLTDAEEKQYLEYFRRLKATLDAGREGTLRPDEVNAHELAALFRIRQWDKGKNPDSSPVQRVAGTLVEIGIDYFNQVPGALNRESSLGKGMVHFLDALDQLPLADKKRLHEHAPRIVPGLFVAAAESVSSLSDELAGDPKIQTFIQSAGQDIAADLAQRLDNLNTGDNVASDRAIQWGRVLLRSTVSNAAHYVVDGPERLFDLNSGGTALIQETGGVLLAAILDDPDRINVAAGFSRPVLDQLLQTTFGVIAQHPTLINNQAGFKEVVSGVSGALAQTSFRDRPDYLPEIVRLILEHSAGQIDTILDLSGSTAQNILLAAARETLFVLSSRTDGIWRLNLGKDQLLRIVNHTISLTAENPNWILDEVRQTSLLREGLSITLDVLQTIPEDQRFSTETILLIIETVLDSLVGNEAILGLIKWADGETEEALLRKGLEILVRPLLRSPQGLTEVARSERRLHRRQLVLDLVEFALQRVLSRHPDKRGLQLLSLMSDQYILWNRNHALREAVAEDMLDLGLQILAAHPDKLFAQDDLAAVGSQLFAAIEAIEMRQMRGYEIIPDLFRLVLRTTAANANLIVRAESDAQPRYLAVVFLWHALEAIAGKDEPGAWCPDLSVSALLELVESMLDVAVAHPEWLVDLKEDDPIHRQVMQAVMDGLAKLPDGSRLQPETLELIFWSAMRAGLTSPLLVAPDDAVGQSLLSQMLDVVVSFVYHPDAGRERTVLLDNILRLVVEDLFSRHPDKRGLALLQLILASYEHQHDRPFDREQSLRLADAGLEVIALHPDLISRDEIWQKLIRDLANSLRSSATPIGHLLPEILRISLRVASGHIEQLMDIKPGSSRILLALAIEQTLRVVTKPPARGKWRPVFSEENLLDFLEVILAEVVANPLWVKDKLLQLVLESIWASIQANVPAGAFTRAVVIELVQSVMAGVRLRRPLSLGFTDANGEEHEMVLDFALDQLFLTIYDPNGDDIAIWTLRQGEVVIAIAEAYFHRLTFGPADEATINALTAQIRASAQTLASNAEWVLEDLLRELENLTV